MSSPAAQRLRVLPAAFTVERRPDSTLPEGDTWIALVRAPEGLTAVRETRPAPFTK
ncbi:hypothetical protein ACIBQ1_35875 [Nonomuraea sp. NPDC050153]|uniref:hypothetical protein n=1 Tax=Nonomuraea sp. NPDC050153 TaxID=3364359 RepID=UPI00378A1A2C